MAKDIDYTKIDFSNTVILFFGQLWTMDCFAYIFEGM